jgi:phosphotransferase system  glucose/maltose/N-acetylglucosamine-specific IIC component
LFIVIIPVVGTLSLAYGVPWVGIVIFIFAVIPFAILKIREVMKEAELEKNREKQKEKNKSTDGTELK